MLDAGSLYWVIDGTMLVRQRITGITPATRADGSACAAIGLDRAVVPVDGRPVKAFQGWRYLRGEDAPEDLAAGSDQARAAARPGAAPARALPAIAGGAGGRHAARSPPAG